MVETEIHGSNRRTKYYFPLIEIKAESAVLGSNALVNKIINNKNNKRATDSSR